ncbi:MULTISPECIES: hypothetical protein [Vibrio]|uniref:Uncharacterized protein n=2 Tax=Vibrio cholerae TaxID=666 RepID=A0A5B1C5X3_VIBCL|nr:MULTISPECIES: hypothetical protein [Vibrio]EGQ7787110.1 hypothetical protein [Vibrio cholerae]EGQ7967700.1 hypothetical protein [Vibrio cholerae]EGQ9170045.1 hypothetical protein [Vibrio cholerae]EGR0308098.1 hypothetical protein [Vibrio cholerae]EGR1092269.1 hypothetical protein [Vibrio cholerae]
MSAVLILLILVSGFVFTSLHIPARFKQKRTTGWDSYFYVVAWGTLWGFIAAIICVLIDFFNCVALTIEHLGYNLKDVSKLSIKFDDIRTIAFAFVSVSIALICGLLSRLYFTIFPDKKLKHIAKIAKNDHLDTFILEASATQIPILVTLGSRKCYVGICFGEAGFDDGGSEHISLLPLLSGYRDKDKLSLNILTNYHIHYEDNDLYDGTHDNLTLDQFRVIIPKSEVEIYSFFDIATFKQFKEVEKKCDKNGADNGIGIPNSEFSASSVQESYRDFNSTSSG